MLQEQVEGTLDDPGKMRTYKGGESQRDYFKSAEPILENNGNTKGEKKREVPWKTKG